MGSKIEWTDETWNPLVGCSRVSPGCDNCLDADTLVLYENMTWRPIGEVRPGDRLVAVDENLPVGANRCLRVAIVERMWRVVAPAVELLVGSTHRVVASADHRWLAKNRPWWRTTSSLRIGTLLRTLPAEGERTDGFSEEYMRGYIAGATVGDGTYRYLTGWRSDKLGYPQAWWRVAEPDFDLPVLERLRLFLLHFGIEVQVRRFDGGGEGYVPKSGRRAPMSKVETRKLADLAVIDDILHYKGTLDWKRGWVAGLFDTDGSFSGSVRVAQSKDNGALDAWSEYVRDLGFNAKVERWRESCPSVRLEGGLTDRLAFFASIRPALTRKMGDHYGRLAELDIEPVTGLRFVGSRELVDIQTSTGTFMAAGIVSHNCYAAREASGRLSGLPLYNGLTKDGVFTGEVRLVPERLDQPLRWKKPRRIFVNSMSDLFHPDVPDEFRVQVFDIMAKASQHTFQILTKRPQVMARFASAYYDCDHGGSPGSRCRYCTPLPRVWLGTSIENDRYTFRANHLRDTPAAVRFLSLEPLLGPLPSLDLNGIDWVIVGGESGPKARPMHPQWVRDIRDQCVAENVAFLFKQWGEWQPTPIFDAPGMLTGRAFEDGTSWVSATPGDYGKYHWLDNDTMAVRVGKKAAGRELDGRIWDEYPRSHQSCSEVRNPKTAERKGDFGV